MNQTPFTPTRRDRRHIGLGVAIGNFVEWYDFAVYSAVVVTIGTLFFPSDDPVAQTLAAFAAFAVGFLLRPIGGLLIGVIGDRKGRKTALMISVALMGIATTLMGLLPTATSIGVGAPLLLIITRAVQGLSAGGESVAAITYLAESAKDRARGRMVSIVPTSVALAFVTAAVFVWALQLGIGEENFAAWGWRIPFLASAPIALLAFYVRTKLAESPVFNRLNARGVVREKHRPLATAAEWRNFGLVFTVAGLGGLGLYYLNTYLSAHLSSDLDIDRPEALALSSIGLVIYAALCPIAGWFADTFGRRPAFLVGAAWLAVAAIPVFLLLGTRHPVLIVFAYVIFAVGQSLVINTSFLYLVELMPSHSRATSSSIAYNIAYALIAGTGPYVATFLVQQTSNPLAPAWYLASAAVLAVLIAALWLPETRHRDLHSRHSAPTRNKQKTMTAAGV